MSLGAHILFFKFRQSRVPTAPQCRSMLPLPSIKETAKRRTARVAASRPATGSGRPPTPRLLTPLSVGIRYIMLDGPRSSPYPPLCTDNLTVSGGAASRDDLQSVAPIGPVNPNHTITHTYVLFHPFRRICGYANGRHKVTRDRAPLETTARARPLRALKHPLNSVLAGVMTDDRRTFLVPTVVTLEAEIVRLRLVSASGALKSSLAHPLIWRPPPEVPGGAFEIGTRM